MITVVCLGLFLNVVYEVGENVFMLCLLCFSKMFFIAFESSPIFWCCMFVLVCNVYSWCENGEFKVISTGGSLVWGSVKK